LAVDSSLNGVNANYTGSPTFGGASGLFDGSGTSINFASGGPPRNNLNQTLGLTSVGGLFICEALIKMSSTSIGGCFFYLKIDSKAFGIGSGTTTGDSAGNNLVWLQEGNAWFTNGGALGTDWKHVAFAFHDASSTIALIMNGSVVSSGTNNGTASGSNLASTFGSSDDRPLSAGSVDMQHLAIHYIANFGGSSQGAAAVAFAQQLCYRHTQRFRTGF
jgi:hypothetical protein